jgi:glycerate kinase
MRIVVAPDKLKGTCSATDAADAIATGVIRALPDADVDRCPISDGGEGFVETMVRATGGRLLTRRVTGPLTELRVEATFGFLGNEPTTAVIEMSSAAGLVLLPAHLRDPTATTTFGVGELIRHAIDAGAKHIIIGIGGSATCDAGIGCAQACGLPVLLRDGHPVHDGEPLCGRDLERVYLVKRNRGSVVDGVRFTVACDVTNPLFGENGAAFVYAPQKGATPQQVRELDRGLRHLARTQNALDLAERPGAGAAGGLGFGMMAFFDAEMRRGADLVIEAVGLEDRLKSADLCFTAEGRVDEQSASGKATHAVASLCRRMRVPCVVLAGSVGDVSAMQRDGATACLSLCDRPMTLEDASREVRALLSKAAETATRLFVAGRLSASR